VNSAGDVGLACLAGIYLPLAVSSLLAPLILSRGARAVTNPLARGRIRGTPRPRQEGEEPRAHHLPGAWRGVF
jgi:hypothetical protein